MEGSSAVVSEAAPTTNFSPQPTSAVRVIHATGFDAHDDLLALADKESAQVAWDAGDPCLVAATACIRATAYARPWAPLPARRSQPCRWP